MSSIHTISDGIAGKICPACGEWKPLIAFGIHHRNLDGLNCRCKKCCNGASQEFRSRPSFRAKNRERMRAYRQTPTGKIAYRRAGRTTRARHPVQTSAGSAIAHAIVMGRLPHASNCECADCGMQAEHYHHESYDKDKWLDVIPLCRNCHNQRHGRLLPYMETAI